MDTAGARAGKHAQSDIPLLLISLGTLGACVNAKLYASKCMMSQELEQVCRIGKENGNGKSLIDITAAFDTP